jgi:hypothetical protein
LKYFTNSKAIPKISDEEKETCDSEIIESEILSSLKDLKSGRSPGTDGLTADFYKFFWVDIKVHLTNSLKYSLDKGKLSVEQRRGIITLLPKK